MNYSKRRQSVLPSVRSAPPAARVSAREEITAAPIIKGIVGGLFVYALVGVALTLISAAILLATPDPDSLILPFSIASQLIATFVGGILSSRRAGGYPLVCGLLFGACVTVISMLFSLLLPDSLSAGLSFIGAIGFHLPAILSGLLGSAAGSIKKRDKRARKYGYR